MLIEDHLRYDVSYYHRTEPIAVQPNSQAQTIAAPGQSHRTLADLPEQSVAAASQLLHTFAHIHTSYTRLGPTTYTSYSLIYSPLTTYSLSRPQALARPTRPNLCTCVYTSPGAGQPPAEPVEQAQFVSQVVRRLLRRCELHNCYTHFTLCTRYHDMRHFLFHLWIMRGRFIVTYINYNTSHQYD